MSWLMNVTNSTVSVLCEGQEQGYIFWMCATTVSIVFGFPGAVAVFLDLFHRGRKGLPFTSNDVFMTNLTIMDVFYWSFLLPKMNNKLHRYSIVYEHLFYALFSFSLCGRPLFITCICLDCYLAIVHPVTYRVRKGLTPRVLMAVGVWIVTLIYGYYIVIRQSKILTDLSAILFFSLTLPVMGYCDFSILWTLKRSNPAGGDVHPQKKKALQIIINNLVITFTSYVPPIVTVFLSKFLSLDEMTIRCLMLIPVMGITNFGNSVSIILHLNNLGKLDWLKCWKQK